MDDHSMGVKPLREVLEQRIASLQANPSLCWALFRVDTRLVDRLLCEARTRDLPPVLVDEPAVMGGTNQAFTPVELILAALGACQEIMYMVYAGLMGVELTGVEVKLKGRLNLQGLFGLAEGVSPGLTRVESHVILESHEPEHRLQELVRVVESRCPVLDVFTRPVEVVSQVTYRRGEQDGEG